MPRSLATYMSSGGGATFDLQTLNKTHIVVSRGRVFVSVELEKMPVAVTTSGQELDEQDAQDLLANPGDSFLVLRDIELSYLS